MGALIYLLTGEGRGAGMYSGSLEEQMFFDGRQGAYPLYCAFAERLFRLLPETTLRVQKTQITFCNPRVFACVSFLRVRRKEQLPKDYFVLTLGLPKRLESPRVAAAVEPCPGRWTHHIVVSAPEQLDRELFCWVEQAAEFSREK